MRPDKESRPQGDLETTQTFGGVGSSVVGEGVARRFQPMPNLSPDQWKALKADIKANGIRVPVVVDQHGRVLDGHNRIRIAKELGIECPTEVISVADDAEAMRTAVTLNCARRHLTREQVRQVIEGELVRNPEDSDRAIARRVGCSPTTVGAVRSGASKLDTSLVASEEARESVDATKKALEDARAGLAAMVLLGLDYRVSVPELVAAVRKGRQLNDATNKNADVAHIFGTCVFDPILDQLLDPELVAPWQRHQGPGMPEANKQDLLVSIANLGNWSDDSRFSVGG